MRILVAIVTVALIVLAATNVAGAAEPHWLVEVTLDGRRLVGTPLSWDDRQARLLGRDGQLWTVPRAKARDWRKTGARFTPSTISELRAELLREMGKGFEVSGTGHYLVVHPRGTRDLWAGRFEDLYRSFVQYFTVRGFKLAEPAFPLIGIVCRNQGEFQQYSAKRGLPVGGGVMGYYSLTTNRVLLFDARGGRPHAADWKLNAATVIHEATHQTAFNTGIHSRFTAPPVWVAEGLATMFEAPGVYNSRSYPSLSDRINRERLEDFRRLVAPNHQPHLLAGLIASDELFERAPAAAYAEAWALTFFLIETDRAKYAEFLARTARRPPFTEYTADERTEDFTAVFGSDWAMLQARFLRFMQQVK